MFVIMTKHSLADEDDYLAAEYALGLLNSAEREAFHGRLAASPGLAESLRGWDEHFAGFSNEIASVQPPRHVQDKLQKRLFGADEHPTSPVRFWSNLNLWRSFAAASFASLLLVSGLNLRQYLATQDTTQVMVADVAGEAGGVKLVALYDQQKGELRLNRITGAPQGNRSFELWLIAGQDAPVSLGVLPVEATGHFSIPIALRSKFATGVLAISDEPKGGSPTGGPTGAVLATGKFALI